MSDRSQISSTQMRVSVLVAVVGVGIVAGLRISPEIEPKSDEKFFGDDYPDDHRVLTPSQFSHPYPHVEASDEYDKDFVRDENSDNGEWAAQYDYDQLRHKVDLAKTDMALAKKQMEGHDTELSDAEKAEEEAKRNKLSADDAVEAARKREEDAKRVEADLEKAVQAANASKGSADMTLEECMKALGKSKAKAKKLHEEAVKAEDAERKAKADADLKARIEAGDISALKEAHEAAKREAAKADGEANALQELVDKLKKEAADREQHHNELEHSQGELQEKIGKAKEKLEEAADRLKEVRQGQVSPGGGIYRTEKEKQKSEKSAACSRSTLAAVVAMAFTFHVLF